MILSISLAINFKSKRMNPLLNRLFEDRSKSKTKRLSLHREEHNLSVDKALVPKIPTRVKLESLLPQPQIDRRKGNPRVYVGRLPTISLKIQDVKEHSIPRPNFRNRKLSTSIKDMNMQGHFFSTELADNPALTTEYQPMEQTVKHPEPVQAFNLGEEDEQELFQYLKVIENNEELKDEFCYMNRRELPYSFYIVDYEGRNREEFLTVSLRGITHFREGEDEFYSIRKYTREIEQFKAVKRIPFFRDYLHAKVLLHWKDRMVRKIFNLKCRFLISHLFSQNMLMQQYLHFLHSLAEDYSAGNFYPFTLTSTLTLTEFQSMAEHTAKDIAKSVRRFDSLVEKQLNQTIESLMSKFRSDERVTLKSADKQDTAYLPFDSKRRSMKYTQMAKLKEFQGSMYRLIKYTDMLRFNTKISLLRRCYENAIQEMRSLRKAFLNKDTMRFTNWIQVDVSVIQNVLVVKPQLDEVAEGVLSVKDLVLKEIFRDHRLLSEKKDSMLCEDVELDEDQERPSKFQLKYYILKSPQFQQLESQLQHAFKQIIGSAAALISKCDDILMTIYRKNSLGNSVTGYLSNTAILDYLSTFRQEYSMVNSFEELGQFALVAVNVKGLKECVQRGSQEKHKAISNAVPGEILQRCERLQVDIRNIHSSFKENPYNVQDYILFSQRYSQSKYQIPEIQSRLESLLEFEELVYRHNIRIGESAKLVINDVQVYFRELSKRVEQVEGSEEAQRKKFQTMVEDMVPLIQEKSETLAKELQSDDLLNSPASQLVRVFVQLKDLQASFDKIRLKREQLFEYQRQLRLGHRQLEAYDRLELSLRYMHKVWQSREYFKKLEGLLSNTGYGHVNELQISPLLDFLNNSDSFSGILGCHELLQDSKAHAIRLQRVVKISQLVSADSLQAEHLNNLKKLLRWKEGHHVETLFTRQGNAKVSCTQLMVETNVVEIEDEISEIVFLSAQESIVKGQLLEIEEYWRKVKLRMISEDLGQNDVLVSHLDSNEEVQEKLGNYLVTLKNIEGSVNLAEVARSRAQANLKVCVYMRELLWKWAEVERQWIKLLPLMTNCPAVKHQSNVFFDFASVDTSVRRIIRHVGEMGSLRKLCDDHQDKRYLGALNDCAEQLQHINTTFGQFLQGKRSTYGRFYFLSDQELINILQHVRDARSASRYVSLCFNCHKLQLDNELMAGFEQGSQVFKMRKIILKGETDELFRSIEENMKNALKLNVKTFLPKLKVSPDLYNELQENPLQVVLISDRIFWTEMSEAYLATTSYPQYRLLFTTICQQMLELLLKSNKKLWQKLSFRYVQMSSLKDTGLELIHDQITVQDFKWKEQIRMYSIEEDIVVSQFQGKLLYGCEYYPRGDLSIPTGTSTRFLYEAYHSCTGNRGLVINGDEGEGKRHLIQEAGSYFGVYQREVICNSRLSQHFVTKLVQGALSSGAWLAFYEFNALNYSVLAELLFLVGKANAVEYKSQQYLFMFVHHKLDYQQISLYSFNHFAVYEPDKQKIAQYLLQVYRFKESAEVANKLIRYLRFVNPILEGIMGSEFQLARKVIKSAGEKRLQAEIGVNENLLIAETIFEQIIQKESESKAEVLHKSLSAYFGTEYKIMEFEGKYEQKLQTLARMITERVPNIIVLGHRTCKTTLIKESLSRANKEGLYIYGETTDNYFGSEAMQFLRVVQKDKVIVYDSNHAISEWVDLIASGYLFMQGKKVILENQIVMELRDISKNSPSFVGRCQILYVGQHIVSKWDKLERVIGRENNNYRCISEVLQEMFGKHLQGITELHLNILAHVLKGFKEGAVAKNVHRAIAWILSIIDKENTWNRYYGGRHIDFTLSGSQLVALDQNKVQSVPHPLLDNYMIVPTKTNVLLLEGISMFHQLNIPIHLEGPYLSGKSSLLMFFLKRYHLNPRKNPHEWSEYLKSKYTFVRKQARNILVDLQKQGHKIIVDDLDLGTPFHLEYLRVLIESSSFRDKNFNEYKIDMFKLLTCSRHSDRDGKYWSNVCTLSFKQLDRESVETIYHTNFSKQIAEYSMNRQVQELIQGSIIKAILIAHDDLSNIFGVNNSAGLLLGLLRNLLSLPKRQGYISNTNYYGFFKTMCLLKLKEKGLDRKSEWQVKGVYDNLFKVVFNDKNMEESQRFLYSQGHFKASLTTLQMKDKLQSLYPSLVCFDKLLNSIYYLINQLGCMDNRIVLLGKKGSGKKLIIEIVSKLSGVSSCSNFSEAVIAAIKGQRVILVDSLQKNQSYYEDLQNCENDKELQRLINMDMKQQFRSRAAGEESTTSIILQKCKKTIIFAFLCDFHSYHNFANRRRLVLSMPVCLVEEWPPEALLNIYSVEDSYANLHAQIFISANKIITANRLPSFSLKIFEKYLRLYSEIYKSLSSIAQRKKQLLTNIRFKFNESASMISAWQARVQLLKEEITITIKTSQDTIIVNQLYSFALSIYYKQIKGQEEKYAAQTDQLSKLSLQIQKKVTLMEKVLRKIEKIVSSFQRTELGEFKKIYKTNKLIYFGAECLCILLGEESVDEKSINRILADPNLLMRMKAVQVLAERNTKLQAKFSKEFAAIEKEMQSNNNELAKTLIEWLRSILEYWQTSSELRIEQERQKKVSESLEKSSKRYKELQDQVSHIKQQIDEKSHIIEQHKKLKAEKEIQLSFISQKLRNAERIIPLLRHQQQQTRQSIEQLDVYCGNLVGNSILTAFTAVFLSLQPLSIKQELFGMVKGMLKKNIVASSPHFMSVISGDKLESLQSLNYYLLRNSSLPKLVIDPHRKFINYIETNAPLEMIDEIIEHSPETFTYEPGKIYHSTVEVKESRENLLIIDWSALALEEKDVIFLSLAEFKKPEYFQAKNQLEIQINRNLQKLKKMKEGLYQTISEREMKIIDDDTFAQSGEELERLQGETEKLKRQAQEKMRLIESLSSQINEQANKIISIFTILKHFRKVDLHLILGICKQAGNTIETLIRWSLANIKPHNRNHFLLSIVIVFHEEKCLDILRDIVCGVQLKPVECRLKKPQGVSSKHWELVVKLSPYSAHFKKLMDSVMKYQIEFERWCIDPLSHILPEELGVKLGFAETWMLLHHFKPKATPYLVRKLVKEQLGYDLTPLPNKAIIEMMDTKFPVLLALRLEQIVKLARQSNEARHCLLRVSKIKGQVQMKRVIWKSMQAKQWLICYDVQDAADLQMLEDICYYVMNYDKQPCFRVFLAVDSLIDPASSTALQDLKRTSPFLQGNSVHLYEEEVWCDQILQEYPLQYQISVVKGQYPSTNKQVFNRMFKLIAVCYTVLRRHFPEMRRLPFKRIVDTLQFIKFKNITVEFNVFTIVQYFSRITSHVIADAKRRREVDELWEHIVDEGKMQGALLHGIRLEQDNYNHFLIDNHEIIGCTQAYFIRRDQQEFPNTLQLISHIFSLHPSYEEVMVLIRTQLARLPSEITHKDMNNTYNYYFQGEMRRHNHRIQLARQLLQEVNESNPTIFSMPFQEKYKSQFQKVHQLVEEVSKALSRKLRVHSIKNELLQAVSNLRRQHEFILYFNPNLPILLVDPRCVYNIDLLFTTYSTQLLHSSYITNADKKLTFLEFTHFQHQKDLVSGQGLYLSGLNCQEFIYNLQMQTVDPSFEIDGRQECPLVRLLLKQSQQDEVQSLQVVLEGAQSELNIQYRAVYRQWGLRDPKLVLL